MKVQSKVGGDKASYIHDTAIMKKMCQFFKAGCIYHDNHQNFKIYSTSMFVFATCMVSTLTYSIYIFRDSIEDVATIIHHAFVFSDMMVASTVFSLRGKLYQSVVIDMMRTHDYRSKIVDEKRTKLEKNFEKDLEKFYKTIQWSILILVLNFVLFAFVEKELTKKKYLLLFPMWAPVDLDILPWHIFIYIIQTVTVIWLGIVVFGILAFIYLIYRQGHIHKEMRVLEWCLKNINKRAEEIFVNSEEKLSLQQAYTESINHCAAHHVEIHNFFLKARSACGPIYQALLITGLVICVCVGFALLSDNFSLKMKFVGITIIQMVWMYIVSWVGDVIAEQNGTIQLVIFSVEWYNMPVECWSTLRIMMENTKKPMSLVASSGQKANLDNFMSMLKAAYSFFNTLFAAQEN